MEKKVYVIYVEKCSAGSGGHGIYTFSTLKKGKEAMKKTCTRF